MQNTPPVATGGFLWAVGRSLRGRMTWQMLWGALARRCELVKARFRTEEWTEWAPGVLEELGVDEEPPMPEFPVWARVSDRARLLLDLGMDFARVAEVLGVSEEELLLVAPVVDTRVLSVSQSVTTRVRRLREEEW